MAKFPKHPKLTRTERARLLAEFCYALSTIKNPEEASAFLTDLLSSPEVEMLARRVRVAQELIRGDTFEEISRRWKVSTGTIGRISAWLKTSGEGYRLIAERMREYTAPEFEGRRALPAEPFSARWLRRRYPMYYWPQAILEEIVRVANKRRREQLFVAIRKLDAKGRLYKQLQPLLKAQYVSTDPVLPKRHP